MIYIASFPGSPNRVEELLQPVWGPGVDSTEFPDVHAAKAHAEAQRELLPVCLQPTVDTAYCSQKKSKILTAILFRDLVGRRTESCRLYAIPYVHLVGVV